MGPVNLLWKWAKLNPIDTSQIFCHLHATAQHHTIPNINWSLSLANNNIRLDFGKDNIKSDAIRCKNRNFARLTQSIKVFRWKSVFAPAIASMILVPNYCITSSAYSISFCVCVCADVLLWN